VTPEQAARRWQQAKIARQRRDVELETFPTTAGSDAKTSHPMFGTGRPASPARARLPGLVVEPPAPAGMTSWGTWSPAPIEHVGGGYHLLACNLISNDPEWMNEDGVYVRWAIAVWLIRPDGSISEPWVSDGNTARPSTSGPFYAENYFASPYGEPTELCMPKLTRWQEGALLSFTIFTYDRQYVDDLSDFWPQVEGSEVDNDFGVPWGANIYRWIGHDTVNPVVGPPLELYNGPDSDFSLKGDWDTGGGVTEHDDGTVEGFEVVGPSADANIAVLGQAYNSRRTRVWLLDKDPADNTLTLAQRTTLGGTAAGSDPRLANPGGLTRIATDRWVGMVSLSNSGALDGGMWAALFNAKTGTIVDTAAWDPGGGSTDCYFINAYWGYHAGNHLHFDGQAVFAVWWKTPDFATYSHRHTTLTVDGDTLTVGDVVEWDSDDSFVAERLVETCEGCLRLILTYEHRRQALFEGRVAKAGIAPLPSPELPGRPGGVDQRLVPSSHPVGYMWLSNLAFAFTDVPEIPQLVRYPA